MRLILLVSLLSSIINTSYSQTEKEILESALKNYRNILPDLEKRAFKLIQKLDKEKREPKNREFNRYSFIIIPMFELKKNHINYEEGDFFAKNIDFDKLYDDFTAFVFKDTIFCGSLHMSSYDNSYFSVDKLNAYNTSAFIALSNLVRQIIKFNPDLVFYPQSPLFISFIKDGQLYVGTGKKQMKPVDKIILIDDVIKLDNLFIKELYELRYP
ncbi:hypothetical protein [Pedobacter glucosidilyticus]|uniref:hypothetical protein n=1 Tax=Pedobacter glucosidilyticus TaxID=1122941 RepID=UPI0026EB1A75|nr:hypothetical protein [Pedobacter glucosidilyticus]